MKTYFEKLQFITFPECGAQYLPCEIYYPDEFLGKSYQIDKVDGQIEAIGGTSMNLTETYTCDKCNTKFETTAKISFKTAVVDKYDFSKSYVTPLFEEKLTLDENM